MSSAIAALPAAVRAFFDAPNIAPNRGGGMSFPRQVVPGRVYLVTRRCTQRQFLLRPDDETNNAFIYCLAYAARKTSVGVVAFIANSNHYHAVVVDTLGAIPQFLEVFHKLLAKHQNVLRGRWENFWSSEQTSLVELVNPEDVFAKILYTLTNPVKDHLVEKAHHWPGASSRLATLSNKVLTARRPRRFFRVEGAMPMTLNLRCVRAPGFESFSQDSYHSTLSKALAKVEADAAAERRRTGRKVLGRQGVLRQRPTDRPQSREPRRVLNPTIAARDKKPRIEAIRSMKRFRAAYALELDGWHDGKLVTFPFGTYWLKRHARVDCHHPPLTDEKPQPLDPAKLLEFF
jgi:putative transposase